MYNRMFDLNNDGKLDTTERTVEFITLQAVVRTDEDLDDTSELGEML